MALIVETFLAPGRDIVRGIARYLREHRPWSIQLEPRRLADSVPPWLTGWDGEGIIARFHDRHIAKAVAAMKLPAVDVLGLVPDLGIPLVHVDHRTIARMAAEDLLDRGFRHFGFLGNEGENYSWQRWEAFHEAVHDAGHDCRLIEVPPFAHREDSWESHVGQIGRWIKNLPKPAGVMVCTDQRGPQVLEACRQVGVAVPDEVAVIGVDNDGPLCEVSSPPLTSVCPDHFGVGYRAAKLLDHLMAGGTPPDGPIILEPRGIVTRLSTDVLAIEDQAVATAVRFIREHACDGIGVEDVVADAGTSRSVLQRRFRKLLDRSIHDEIVQARLKHAQHLLAETTLPIAEIAEKAGFKHQEYMGAVFKTRLRRSPAQVRRGVRP